jgi:hypothetical protein
VIGVRYVGCFFIRSGFPALNDDRPAVVGGHPSENSGALSYCAKCGKEV